MQKIIFVSRDDYTWDRQAQQNLERFGSIILIFERYTLEQRRLLYGALKGYQMIRQLGDLPEQIKQQAISIWGATWWKRVKANQLTVYIQVVNERIRTSHQCVSHTETPKTQSASTVSENGSTPRGRRQKFTEETFTAGTSKTCQICKQTLTRETHFRKQFRGDWMHRQGYCKVCQKYYLRWWRQGKQNGTGQTFKEYCESDPNWKFEVRFRQDVE